MSTPARVVVVTREADAEVVTLLRAELGALGLQVVEVQQGDAPLLPQDLSLVAREQGAVAAFRVSITADRVEVWVADRVTGKVTLREVIRRRPGTPPDVRVVVLQAVELLRWSLREPEASDSPRGEIAEPPPPVTQLVRESPASSVLTFGAAVFGSHLPGGASLGAGVEMTGGLRVGAWGGQLLFAQQLVTSRLASSAGRSDIDATWLGLEATFDVASTSARWQPSLGLGARVVSLRLRGVIDPPAIGQESRSYALVPALHPRLAFALTSNLQLFADASLSVPMPRTELRLAGQPAGTLGRWMGTAGAGLRLVVGE